MLKNLEFESVRYFNLEYSDLLTAFKNTNKDSNLDFLLNLRDDVFFNEKKLNEMFLYYGK